MGGDMPCDVQAVLNKSCATCHGTTPQFGATFSLASASDVRAKGQAILQRTADKQRPMPPPPNALLTTEERAVLEKYINGGAPAGTCLDPTPPSNGGAGGGPTRPNDPDVTCYKMTARSGATQKFTVPTTPDFYHCFNWAPPWGNKKVQVVGAYPLIDNAAVLHHWLLYNADAAVQDATSSDCIGAHPNAALIAGWAPGGEPTTVPSDVGIGLGTGGFVLELHYNNAIGEGQLDASGVEVCVTEKIRPKEAAVHWLGTQALNKTVATGTCIPKEPKEITILSSIPHMHVQGRHMKTVINRAAGGTEILIDKPFDFETQVGYLTPAVIKPGDTLTTTCTYAQPTPFGEGTNQEMCYNFVLAYPAGALGHGFDFLRKYDCSTIF
jgi:hypothetical protein